MANSDPKPPSSPGSERPNSTRLGTYALFAVLIIVMLAIVAPSGENHEETSYSTYTTWVKEGLVTGVVRNNATGEITFTLDDEEQQTYVTNGPINSFEDELALLRENVESSIADGEGDGVRFVTPGEGLAFWLSLALPLIFILGFFWWMSRRAQGQMGGIMNVGRSKAKTYTTERPGTTFDDVAGYDEVKQEIREVVEFLKNPERFAEIGARTPKGMLLVGPPGTGKTLIARAVAGEAGVPFMSVTGSDFMEMFVGVGASRVRDLFESARKMGRAIIFVDEIDSIGRKRGAGLGGGHDEREQTLNQMLAEMDGFEASEGIIIMAATNRPDVLDPALLRPGRFDRQVVVPLPELRDRVQILGVHLKGKRTDPDLDHNVIARGTPGMSGADIANLVNEAALFAVRAGDSKIAMRHFENARDRVLMGVKRESMALTDSEKEAIAYHEAGHALCAAILPTADPLHKVTIIPSGMALGVTMQLPQEEKHIYRQDYIEDRLIVMMGGRMAEELIYGVMSTGGSNDLEQATAMARSMVRQWGMSDRVGPMAWASNNQVFLGEDMMQSRDYSDETARVIDEEIERILRDAEERCRTLLRENRDGLELVARGLLEHETIPGSEVYRLIDISGGQTNSQRPIAISFEGEDSIAPAEAPEVEAATHDEVAPVNVD
ncbi:MAG: ATP-dependent metallopeptidase FtsH/Yme1/Tma family protein [Acidimicrobiales bacterium]|nr:ATP-dependent metallopeptidase FtsH/Yme1/Tma family protein [Acidimicrobiales bacterium]RZV48651.1 MAG: ATP-dependent metallopeptidase FtsH/Yme1/Tma family protein [Acidimicrobiales bacterium]